MMPIEEATRAYESWHAGAPGADRASAYAAFMAGWRACAAASRAAAVDVDPFRCEACGQHIEEGEPYDLWADDIRTHRGDCPPAAQPEAAQGETDSLLLRCHGAIVDAVFNEDGLDASIGEPLLYEIQEALPAPLPKVEHAPNEDCDIAGPHHPSECGMGIWLFVPAPAASGASEEAEGGDR